MAVVPTGAAGQLAGSRSDADQLTRKIAAISQRATVRAPAPASANLTTITERELNAFFTYGLRNELPGGVVNPTLTLLGMGRVAGRALVDLDRVRGDLNATSLFNPISYLTGRLPVVGTGILRTGNGVATFEFESASVAGVPIPKLLLQEIVAYYSRSPAWPAGISLDDPMALPARIREIRVERGQAIVVQ